MRRLKSDWKQARFRGHRRALLYAILGALLALAPASAQEVVDEPAPDWLPSGLAGLDVRELMTPESGAFFARVADGAVYRSDDGGDTWRAVNQPPGGRFAKVNPRNHVVAYGVAPTGLYRTSDDAATWQQVLQEPNIVAVDVSRVDGVTVYALLGEQAGQPARVVRSPDSGEHWSTLLTWPDCTTAQLVFQAHPDDASRVFVGGACRVSAGRDFFRPESSAEVRVNESLDGGAWSVVRPRHLILAQFLPQPNGRMYATRVVPSSTNLPVLERSDDGATWTDVFGSDPSSTTLNLGLLAADRLDPNRIYAGARGAWDGVVTSPDGGATWEPLGSPLPGTVTLAVGVDNQNLYAGTSQGVWRYALSASTPGPDS
jgi:hypothetical protein